MKDHLDYNSENLEVGDYFKISPIWESKHKLNCNYSKKSYQVYGLSKRGHLVYYIDNRTNIKCPCSQCNSKVMVYPNKNKSGYIKVKSIKTMRTSFYMTKDQKFREDRLRKILNK
ncbi:MAG: hypothetical protein SLAVMIC_00971 [uncultured marine phage]|uniref:Uncharacterized protein n=1 Tax=uncultured marine phage TaxID=707152 RepID=A0A8D9CD20_9VIRU|nr:MAG: hypothetical protein SLAVMIC_00971 [uncultured marine phage]